MQVLSFRNAFFCCQLYMPANIFFDWLWFTHLCSTLIGILCYIPLILILVSTCLLSPVPHPHCFDMQDLSFWISSSPRLNFFHALITGEYKTIVHVVLHRTELHGCLIWSTVSWMVSRMDEICLITDIGSNTWSMKSFNMGWMQYYLSRLTIMTQVIPSEEKTSWVTLFAVLSHRDALDGSRRRSYTSRVEGEIYKMKRCFSKATPRLPKGKAYSAVRCQKCGFSHGPCWFVRNDATIM